MKKEEFVQAKKAIIITNKEFEKQLYKKCNNYRNIELYDLEHLRELDKKRQPFFSFRKRKLIEEQIGDIRLNDHSLEPIHRWIR